VKSKDVKKDIDSVSLRDYLTMMINTLESKLLERYHSQEKSLVVALDANSRRLDILNEFRGAVDALIANSVSKDELGAYKLSVDASMSALKDSIEVDEKNIRDKIDSLNISRAELKGKAGSTAMFITLSISIISLIMGAISMIVGVLGFILK
jgi:hypothetical protein